MIRALRTPLLASFHRDRGGGGRAKDFLFRKENQPLFGRRRSVGNSPLDSVRIKVEFFTSLCPFGETFVHFKSPLWYFLHMCGFTVKAGPYHGRRMILTSPQRLGGMLRQYRTETKTLGRSAESFFRRIRMEPILRIRLQELFDSCLEHESETADIHLHLEGSPADYHAATSSLQSRVEMFLELCTHESDSQSTSSAKLCAAADKGKRRRMQLFPFSRPFCRDLFADGEHHPQRLASTTTTTTTTSHAGDGSHDLYVMPLAPSPTLEIPIEVRRALWRGSTAVTHQTDGGDNLDEASKKEKLCEPITHVFSVPDDHGGSSASVCVTRISQEVLRALAESQFTFTCPLTPPPLPIALSTMCVDDSEGGGSARTEEGSTHPNSVTVAYCHMMLSVGVVEFSDLTCSLVQLRRDEANGLLHCTAMKHHVPLFSLATNVCSAVVIANAQFLSHAALHELRASLETNSRTMATAANNHHSMRPAGLLPRWTPLNGGLCVVCIGTFDSSTQAQSNEAPARVAGTENLLHMTLPAFMTDNGNTDRLPNAAREGFSRLIEVLTSVSEESLSVTAVGGSTELCVRESIVQSFLRSTRPISLHAVTALVKSCATGAGVGLLVPEESVPRNTDAPPETQSLDVQSASVIGDMPSLLCIAASTEPQASPVPTIGWKLPQVVAELNQVKILCDDSGSSGLGMARLEKLLNEVPLLKYIAVRHEDTTRFHNLETASTKDCVARLTINSAAGKNAGGGANPLHLQHVVEKRTKKSGKLHEATSPPTRRIYGTSHNVELVESRQAERGHVKQSVWAKKRFVPAL
ncbi:Hypothetical protein, putative [Bodo saltans]|uniref:Uncharacterized protein n=1 Tax=Bodo saltans TaxID=75058 RepID=A0A0S4JCJ2_BODSA|nr:Hypothetical protein, putative [Bodo saltans]|eukprot:CUG87737.1 Hypothetical protein, putative [Bodo saltans]